MKRKWLMIPLATDLLAAALIGAMALAHNEVGEYATRRETVASKVAEILGIEDEQAVKDTLIQATQEVQMERLGHRLEHMVEAGVLDQDQDQANEYLAWYADRPEVPNLHRDGHRSFGFGGGEGEERGPRSSFERQGGRGQDFPGFGDRPDGGQSSEAHFPTVDSSLAVARLASGSVRASMAGSSPDGDNFPLA